MTLHVEELLSTLRFFRGGRVYGDPYDAVATVVLCGDLAYIGAMHGNIQREDWLDMQAELRRRGIIDLLTIRHGQRCWYDIAGDNVVIHHGVRFPALTPDPVNPGPA